MEMIFRLGLDKYKDLRSSVALKKMFDKSFKPVFQKFNCHQWRVDKYWNEECDKVIKDNLKLIKDIFNTFS
jgi:hypothetical protein